MTFATLRTMLRALRSFVTIPGIISLSGVVLAIGLHRVGAAIDWADAALVPDALKVSLDTARSVMATTATASISALVMVYSIVLLVYSMAASSIGPRLLQRFRDDRINQISIGVTGATFLYSLTGLWLIEKNQLIHVTAGGAVVLAALSILLLLYFVNRVSARVTIDQEAAQIAASLDSEIDAMLKISAKLAPGDVQLPATVEREVAARSTGYIDTIGATILANEACKAEALVAFTIRPGDFVIEGECLARVFGDPAGDLDNAVCAAAPIIAARDPAGDLRFSADLLVEIALRALSPGINDTFTAIGCVDRLSASLVRARRRGLSVGVFTDDRGAMRVVYPAIDTDVLFDETIPPLRRAARGNVLMTHALIRALVRMADATEPGECGVIQRELEHLHADLERADLSGHDRLKLAEAIEDILARIGDV